MTSFSIRKFILASSCLMIACCLPLLSLGICMARSLAHFLSTCRKVLVHTAELYKLLMFDKPFSPISSDKLVPLLKLTILLLRVSHMKYPAHVISVLETVISTLYCHGIAQPVC